MQALVKADEEKPSSPCDRKMAFVLFSAIQNKVQRALLEMQNVIHLSRSLKRYPYPMVCKKTLTRKGTGSSQDHRTADVAALPEGDRVSWPADQTADQLRQDTDRPNRRGAAGMPHRSGDIQNTIDERMIDMLVNMKFEHQASHVRIVAMVVDACLRYQIAVRNLVELTRYLSTSFDRFRDVHLVYDGLLSGTADQDADSHVIDIEKDTPPGSAGPSKAMTRIAEVQSQLETIKETLQKFLNQVPSQLGKLRTEMELMAIYDNIDDTVKIHRFLSSQYVNSLISQGASPDLQQAYDLIRQSWEALLPTDF